ncbi:retron St85 family RNA-directed DNA polymerase [Shewanella baltica]|uniref:retron St85 family RNA-directed DNA polymerase n=1 Tax=Shewanella baltica TaxID=62322 RepID=UPI003D7AF579
MNTSAPKKVTMQWESYFKDRGLSASLLPQYLEYIKKLSVKDLPVIFEVEHLSALIGIDTNVIYKMIHCPNSFYREFSIPKRKGGVRQISSPYPSLLLCQNWIYENILKKNNIHPCAHAYSSGRSILTNAKPHLNSKAILKMDMENFFPSLSFNWVVKYFSELGYPNNLSFSLASLCCLNNELPQGASTSPALSNILLYSLDKRLYRLSKSYSLQYTRYADDIAFSGDYIPHKYIQIVNDIVEDYGLRINKNKTNLIIGEKQKIIAGISVKGEEIEVPRKYKRELKKEIHFIRKYGILSHISKKKIKNPNYIYSIEGKLRYLLQVEPTNELAINGLKVISEHKN